MRERQSPFPAAVMEWIQAGAALGLQATDAASSDCADTLVIT